MTLALMTTACIILLFMNMYLSEKVEVLKDKLEYLNKELKMYKELAGKK